MSEQDNGPETRTGTRRRSPAAIRAAAADFRTADEPLSAAASDPVAARRAERVIAACFALAGLCGVGFIVGYVAIKLHDGDVVDQTFKSNLALGLSLTGALAFLGIGAVLWAKKLMPHGLVTEDRHDLSSPQEDQEGAAEAFRRGTADSGVGRRPLLVGSLFAGLTPVVLAPLVLLRDLGPLPHKTLRKTAWFKGSKLIDIDTGEPVKVGDLAIGSIATVMPENANLHHDSTSPTILIRLRPDDNNPLPGRESWAPEGHVAYNKICTHSGCPVGLYEQRAQKLFCPCHQSTFDVPNHCKVVFGPAARPLPQLEITIDDEGFFRAAGDYDEPVGPSFWERG